MYFGTHVQMFFFSFPFINTANFSVFNFFLSLSLQRLMSYQNIKSLLEIYRWNDWQIAAKFDNVSFTKEYFVILANSTGWPKMNICFEN